MAASFVAMNQVFGRIFDASIAEAATPDMANARAAGLTGQMVIDGHTAALKAEYLANGGARSNLRYGYAAAPA